jgi:hypothetical protein
MKGQMPDPRPVGVTEGQGNDADQTSLLWGRISGPSILSKVIWSTFQLSSI